MIGRRMALAALAGGMTVMLGGCGIFGKNSYRFRMTVEVDTPEGRKAGTSVYQVTARKLKALTAEEAERSAFVRGEALMIDLPQGLVFVLLKLPESSKLYDFPQLFMAALDPDFRNDWVESAGRIAQSWATLRGEVKRDDWPLMVRFGDLADPKTVEKVDPDTIGVNRIVVETTSDDVTTGIEKRLGWLKHIDGSLTRRLSAPDPTNPPFSARINNMNFSTEIDRAE